MNESKVTMGLGFTPPTTALLARAEAICGRRGTRLTPVRREVLGHILDAAGPTGAYDLLDRLRDGRAVAPPTVYRALDFLQEQGFVHRIARLAAFVGCVDADHDHAAQFLICRGCGRVAEIEDASLTHALAAAAARTGFAVAGATIEAEGTCADCAVGQAGAVGRAGAVSSAG